MRSERHELLTEMASRSRSSLLGANTTESRASLEALLGSTTTEAINAVLGRELRRADGIFFSGPQWAKRLRDALPHGPFARFVDPSCGIGDLLIEIARCFPLSPSLATTLDDWSQRFSGNDLHAPLAQLAWCRLQALAIRRHGISENDPIERHLNNPQFSSRNALDTPWELRAGDCVLMNPPFHAVTAPVWSKHCTGRVSAAALFIERALMDAPSGTTIVALVPEALRSGSRFSRLREFIRSRGIVHQFAACGRFSEEADIDVAIVSITVGQVSATEPLLDTEEEKITALGDVATVRVGTIVPHRDPKTRSSRLFLDVDGAPIWGEVEVSRRARFVGTTFTPPFVVVRRTSSPSDKQRARSTLVKGKEAVMVENHLLVLLPQKKTLAACRKLMRNLRDARSTLWLNQALRCRHLTVSVMRDLPIWTED